MPSLLMSRLAVSSAFSGCHDTRLSLSLTFSASSFYIGDATQIAMSWQHVAEKIFNISLFSQSLHIKSIINSIEYRSTLQYFLLTTTSYDAFSRSYLSAFHINRSYYLRRLATPRNGAITIRIHRQSRTAFVAVVLWRFSLSALAVIHRRPSHSVHRHRSCISQQLSISNHRVISLQHKMVFFQCNRK